MKLSITKKKQAEGDYSGIDVTDKIFTGVDLHESVFNGSYFTKVHFLNCDLRHTEFTEAKLNNCLFENCNLDYSDFVFLTASQTQFINCSFSHVEWRENSLSNLEFKGCSFYNSTISLCSFLATEFDNTSSSNFCGATKRYNVFSRSHFDLIEDKIDFLAVNYGIAKPDLNSVITLKPRNKKDTFLLLSVAKYFNTLDTLAFVELVVKIGDELSAQNLKNRLQKIKYLILICRLSIQEETISVFGMQLLINGLNFSAKKITEPLIFMELVDLIMFLKTHQYKAMKTIESEAIGLANEYVDSISCHCRLANTYKKEDIQQFTNQMADFLEIPKKEIAITAFQNGSTIFELIIKGSVSLGGFLLFINFSLCQVHKTIDYLAKIKKNLKYLRSKKINKQVVTEKKAQEFAIIPFAVMNNEGNIYYTQVNNIINIHGTKLVKLDGLGEIKAEVKKSKAS